MVSACAGSRLFQSTHPRRVRRPAFQVLILAGDVSIHAPTQGATTGRLPGLQRLDCFNPRTHAGCDNIAEWTQKVHATFQSTHPRRVRPSLRRALPLRPWRFNPRTHAGCDLRVSRFFMPSRVFQSTHPRRVRRSAAAIPCSICCFNPRTHAGCDISSGGSRIARAVSIHAPTQGATPAGRPAGTRASGFNPRTHAGCDQLDVGRIAANRVSIHAPTQGATPPSGRSSGSGMSFQSTHPRRVRRYGAEIASLKADVSIHAPTQGATRVVQSPFFASPSFNPRTHAGCDVARRGGLGDSHGFNPRTHAGCDVTIKHIREPKQCFNPRTHAGCDGFYGPQPLVIHCVSIHAPTQGATGWW